MAVVVGDTKGIARGVGLSKILENMSLDIGDRGENTPADVTAGALEVVGRWRIAWHVAECNTLGVTGTGGTFTATSLRSGAADGSIVGGVR